MSRIVDEFPTGNNRAPRYPYDQWFDGQIWVLEQGVDFTATTEGVRSSLHNHGKRIGVKVKTRVREDFLYVQAVREEDEGGEDQPPAAPTD